MSDHSSRQSSAPPPPTPRTEDDWGDVMPKNRDLEALVRQVRRIGRTSTNAGLVMMSAIVGVTEGQYLWAAVAGVAGFGLDMLATGWVRQLTAFISLSEEIGRPDLPGRRVIHPRMTDAEIEMALSEIREIVEGRTASANS